MSHLMAFARSAHRLQAARFLAIGAFNTLFGYVVYLAGLGLRLTPEAAIALATSAGAIFHYFTTARFVFGHRALDRLPVFVATYALIYAVNAGAIQLLLRGGIGPALAQAGLVPFMAALSFALFRTLLFKPGRPR